MPPDGSEGVLSLWRVRLRDDQSFSFVCTPASSVLHFHYFVLDRVSSRPLSTVHNIFDIVDTVQQRFVNGSTFSNPTLENNDITLKYKEVQLVGNSNEEEERYLD